MYPNYNRCTGFVELSGLRHYREQLEALEFDLHETVIMLRNDCANYLNPSMRLFDVKSNSRMQTD